METGERGKWGVILADIGHGPPPTVPRYGHDWTVTAFFRGDENLLAGTPGEQAAAKPSAAAGERGPARAGMGAERGRGVRHRGTQHRHEHAAGRGEDADVLAGHVSGGGAALNIPFADPGVLPGWVIVASVVAASDLSL